MEGAKINKLNKHRPLHLQSQGAFYFITARTLGGEEVFYNDERKEILFKVIVRAQKLYGVKIFGYIIWSNHYHLIVKLEKNILHNFINNIHTHSARLVNKLDNKIGRRVWYQYWDRFLRINYSLDDLYYRMSYILHNPIKHRWCKNFDETINYPWSSVKQWIKWIGRDGLFELWIKYSVKDWSKSD